MTVQAELAVVGSCLVEEAALSKAAHLLRPEHFADEKLRTAFQVMIDLRTEGVEVDAVTVADNVAPEDREKLSRAFLLDLVEKVPTALHVEHYASIVKREFFRRTLGALHEKAKADPLNAEVRDEIREAWDRYLESRGRLIDLDEGLRGYIDRLERRNKSGKVDGIHTGFPGLDSLTNGLRPGQLWVVGARTSRGKTTLCLNLADHFVSSLHRCAFMSAEMGYDELVDRMVSSRSGIPLKEIRGKLDAGNWPRVTSVLGDLHKKPLKVEDQGRLTLELVRSTVEAAKPEVLFVDYIQRFIPPHGANRAAYFSDVANELKALAREKQITVVATSQINRGVEEGGKEREPTLADLKESGGIEEAADVVLLLYSRNADDKGATRLFDFVVAKQRNGPLGRVKFVFLKSTVSFREYTDEDEQA